FFFFFFFFFFCSSFFFFFSLLSILRGAGRQRVGRVSRELSGEGKSVGTVTGCGFKHVDGVAFFFRLHLVLGMTLFLLFPFSRLVHIWSVPVEYLTRKYQL
ncbi:respiratory nitrate reductase subunit gamma, partial [Escherichia coli]|uniref:respiratory nitrate reductase subunit gamma n=1 Tax=Escherichia coli TaxID=562 RepID=UPI0035DA20E4